ncbi:topoisomerase [Solibacillus sp. R5-41]|uniref:topoisomerase n=1 Tax=Solibacillus sp. R5-41 TaxID=2048654 RepID=UPI000C124B40|nr:topoisomerase [Solibacillus sp. R5-41]ATP40349.1 topoisomerase [Solibacillus sp. R5-41]
MKKTIILGIVFSSILLVGCNGEEVIDITENGENDAILSPERIFLSELHNEIIISITEQTELDSEEISISAGGNFKELSVSVSFPKDVKVDDTMIQQIVKDSIKKVSETENVKINEGDITIKIRKYYRKSS